MTADGHPGRGTAVVTGASSGIGAATAVRLAREGFSVVLGARRLDRVAQVGSACGPSARALPPALIASGNGHVVVIGSIASHEPYPGGAATT